MGNHTAQVAVLLAMIGLSSFSAEVTVNDRVLPLMQDGGGYSSVITIVNLESTSSRYEIPFLTQTGRFGTVPISGPSSVVADGSYVRGTLAAGRSVTFRTTGAGSDLGVGHATVFSQENARLGMNIVIQRHGATVLTLPLSPEREDRLVLPFDNTDGASTSLLWLSDSPFALVTYRAISEEGKELATGTFQFSIQDDLVQIVFAIADRIPETAALRGTVELRIDYPSAGIYDPLYFTGLVLQTDSSGTTTAMRSMEIGTWRSLSRQNRKFRFVAK